jgi:hypothetical protein
MIPWAAESLAAAALSIHRAGVVFAGQPWAQVRRVEKRAIGHCADRAYTVPSARHYWIYGRSLDA